MLQNYHKMSKKNVNQTEKFKDLENYQTLIFFMSAHVFGVFTNWI